MNKFLLAFIAQHKLPAGTTEEQATAMLADYQKVEANAEEVANKAAAFDKASKMEVFDKDGKKVAFSGTTDEFAAMAEGHTIIPNAKLTELETEAGKVATLTSEKASLEKDATYGKAQLDKKRAETERLYGVFVGVDKKADAQLGLIKKATSEELDAMLAQYTKGATEKFTATCKSCASTQVEFRSTLEEGETAESLEDTTLSFDDLYAEGSASSMQLGKK